MICDTVEIDFARMPDYRRVSTLLSALAYPEDRQERQDFLQALERYWFQFNAANWPDHEHVSTAPAHLASESPKHGKKLAGGCSKLADRLCCGKLFMHYVMKHKYGRAINVTIEMAEKEFGPNFRSRVWGPSKPVLHIAAAYAVVSQNLEREFFGNETRYDRHSRNMTVRRTGEEGFPLHVVLRAGDALVLAVKECSDTILGDIEAIFEAESIPAPKIGFVRLSVKAAS